MGLGEIDVADCANAAFPLPSLLFTAGALAVFFYLKRTHNLTLGQTFSALVGVRRVKHDRVSSALMVLTLIVPAAIWVYLGSHCG
jgi:hypothetical protein